MDESQSQYDESESLLQIMANNQQSEESMEENLREESKMRQRALREAETYQQTELRRAIEAQRQRERRSHESEEEVEERRHKSALAKRLNRSQEDVKSLIERRAIEAERQRQRRALRVMSETEEQKRIRKTTEAERQRLRRANETEEQKAERRRKGAAAIAMRRWNINAQSTSAFLPPKLKQEMDEFNLSHSLSTHQMNSFPGMNSVNYLTDVNVIYERYVFGSAIQEETETILNFIERLKHLSMNCGYQNMTEDLIRDRLILGIRDDEMRKVFLADTFLTLQGAITHCESFVNNTSCYGEPVNIKIEPDLEVYESSSSDLELLPIKVEMGSPVHEEYILAETIDIIKNEDEVEPVNENNTEEMDISWLSDVKTYHKMDVPKYSCNICDATFFELLALTYHIKICKTKKKK